MLYILIFFLEVILLYILSRKLKNKLLYSILKVTKRKRLSFYIFAFIFLPGTYFHELCHGLAAKVLFVRMGKLNLKPILVGNKLKLGSVSIVKSDLIRRTIIGIAPFFLGISTILFLTYFAVYSNLPHSSLIILIIGYIIFQIANSLFLSTSDLKYSWKGLPFFLIFAITLYRLGVKINLDLIKISNLYLLLPIAIDFILLVLLRALRL